MRRVTLTCIAAARPADHRVRRRRPAHGPDAPTAPTVTETFTGTLTVNGATTHPFPIDAIVGGTVTATLKTIAPDGDSVVGLSLGTWNGSTCQA